MRLRPLAAGGIGLWLVASAACHGQPAESTPPDDDALSLADQAQPEKRGGEPLRFFGEVALGRTSWRDDGSTTDGRLSLDLRYQATIAAGWRATLSNRLDLNRQEREPRQHNINTLREAFLSWHVTPQSILDVGRINIRHGVGYGYNPTDFFKTGALRSIVSLDPAALRENRQGTFAVQGQQLWTGGSLSAAWSPDLGKDRPSDAAFSLDTGATNPRQRWLAAASHKLSDALSPQLLVFGGEGLSTQFGVNLSALVTPATVAFLEAASGRAAALTAKAIGIDDPRRQQRRASLGFTHTTPFNLALTVEAEYDSAAPTREQWNAFSAAAPGNALRLLAESEIRQDLPMRRALFVHAAWQDALVPRLDLAAFVRHDAETHSQSRWLEARYRWERGIEVALQWIAYAGEAGSIYGSMPVSRGVNVALRIYR
jgi:hypothetical protein